MEEKLPEIEIHNNIVRYKGKEYQISQDGKHLIMGLKWLRIPTPYKTGRGKKWRVEIQLGKDPQTGKRIRKRMFFEDYKTAWKAGIKMVIEKQLKISEDAEKYKEEILKEAEKKIKYERTPKMESKKPVIHKLDKRMPKIRKHGRKWLIQIKKEGKVKSYLFDTYEEAEAFAREIAREKIKNKRDLTFGEGVKIYAEYHFSRKQDLGKLRYFFHRLSGFFKKWGEDFPWYKINEITLENYINERLKDKSEKTGEYITESTIKSELKFLNAVWNYLLRNGYFTGINYADKILKERKFEEKRRKRVLSYEETIRFLKATLELPDDRINKQKRGILWIGLFTGARKEEIFKLRKEHVRIVKIDDKMYGMIHFTSDITKTGKERKIEIPYGLAMFLLSVSKGSDMLFPDFQTGYQQRRFTEWFYNEFLKKCEIENFYFHDFRHNWATRAEDMGTPMRIIKELGGWVSYHSTEGYIHPLRENKRNPMVEFVNHLIMEIYNVKKLKELEDKKGIRK